MIRASDISPMEHPSRVRFTLDEYLHMAEDGYFLDQRTEFIDGEILHMPPQKNDHVYAVSMLSQKLTEALNDKHWVRVQATLKIGTIAAPEPDIAVVAGPPTPGGDYATSALFVVEVSESTLEYDRTTKASLYAFAQVPEYWIVNLVDGRIEVHRNPVEDQSAVFGWRYGKIDSLDRDSSLPLPPSLGAAGAAIRAAEVLP